MAADNGKLSELVQALTLQNKFAQKAEESQKSIADAVKKQVQMSQNGIKMDVGTITKIGQAVANAIKPKTNPVDTVKKWLNGGKSGSGDTFQPSAQPGGLSNRNSIELGGGKGAKGSPLTKMFRQWGLEKMLGRQKAAKEAATGAEGAGAAEGAAGAAAEADREASGVGIAQGIAKTLIWLFKNGSPGTATIGGNMDFYNQKQQEHLERITPLNQFEDQFRYQSVIGNISAGLNSAAGFSPKQY